MDITVSATSGTPRAEPQAGWSPIFSPAPKPKLMLSIGISDYDHVRDLTAGAVLADGIDLLPLTMPVEEVFFRFIKFREWDISEMSMAKYVSLISQGDTSLVAIPVFPSRVFRHSSIYVRKDGPVKAPADLAGARIGLPEWAQTAAIYSRGFLAHQFGLDLRGIDWVQAGVNEAGRQEKVALKLPEGIRLASRPDTTLDAMLLSGEIDAMLSAHPPHSFESGHPNIRRLFDDIRTVEQAYFDETGIFPIMHTIAIRAEIVQRFPWVAMNLLKAFEEAKTRSVARLKEMTASRFPLPWVQSMAEAATGRFGSDLWPYGTAANRKTLEAFLLYAFEQGVCHRHLTPEDLFAPQVSTMFRI